MHLLACQGDVSPSGADTPNGESLPGLDAGSSMGPPGAEHGRVDCNGAAELAGTPPRFTCFPISLGLNSVQKAVPRNRSRFPSHVSCVLGMRKFHAAKADAVLEPGVSGSGCATPRESTNYEVQACVMWAAGANRASIRPCMRRPSSPPVPRLPTLTWRARWPRPRWPRSTYSARGPTWTAAVAPRARATVSPAPTAR